MATSILAPPSPLATTPVSPAAAPPAAATRQRRKSEWSPRIWEGSDFFAWLRLLGRNGCRVHWSRWYVLVAVTIVSFFNTLLGLLQWLIFGRKLRRTEITEAPIFIIGHWRTGTTHLHELIIQDPRFGYPNTYQCMEPNHFLLSEWLFTRLFRFLMPKHRPMDNMKAGFDRPQEDEFALCMLGAPSPYLTIAFPNHPPQYTEYYDLEGLPPGALNRWKRTLKNFLKALTYKTGKQLVLKSPPHTARVKILKDMFPRAKFIHIVRDPQVVFASTVNMWKAMFRSHGLQRPTFAGLEEMVFDNFLRLHARLEEAKAVLDSDQFFDLKYEDLIRDPEGQLQALYDHFQWQGFEDCKPRVRAYLAGLRGYETNHYDLDENLKEKIRRRWGKIISQHGYDNGAGSHILGEERAATDFTAFARGN